MPDAPERMNESPTRSPTDAELTQPVHEAFHGI